MRDTLEVIESSISSVQRNYYYYYYFYYYYYYYYSYLFSIQFHSLRLIIYKKIDRQRNRGTAHRTLRAVGCTVPSIARAILVARGVRRAVVPEISLSVCFRT